MAKKASSKTESQRRNKADDAISLKLLSTSTAPQASSSSTSSRSLSPSSSSSCSSSVPASVSSATTTPSSAEPAVHEHWDDYPGFEPSSDWLAALPGAAPSLPSPGTAETGPNLSGHAPYRRPESYQKKDRHKFGNDFYYFTKYMPTMTWVEENGVYRFEVVGLPATLRKMLAPARFRLEGTGEDARFKYSRRPLTPNGQKFCAFVECPVFAAFTHHHEQSSCGMNPGKRNKYSCPTCNGSWRDSNRWKGHKCERTTKRRATSQQEVSVAPSLPAVVIPAQETPWLQLKRPREAAPESEEGPGKRAREAGHSDVADASNARPSAEKNHALQEQDDASSIDRVSPLKAEESEVPANTPSEPSSPLPEEQGAAVVTESAEVSEVTIEEAAAAEETTAKVTEGKEVEGEGSLAPEDDHNNKKLNTDDKKGSSTSFIGPAKLPNWELQASTEQQVRGLLLRHHSA